MDFQFLILLLLVTLTIWLFNRLDC